MIKVVCLDLDGVLFEKVHENLIQNLSQKFNIEEEELKDILFVKAAEEGGYNELKKGTIEPSQYWNWLFAELGTDADFTKEDYINELHKGYHINPKAIELINILRSNGIRTALCSNNYKDNIEALEKKFSLSNYFDVIAFSYEIGALKPDKKIFEELVSRAKVKPEEIVYSDDNEAKLAGAKEIGIKTFVFKNFEQFKKELSNLGVET
ncbi:HAD family phosphatase [Candidatus Dojkabacteria bacterium]|nr:HAD family phosphatase [Candidatus Dojkabacteria bacterium]